VKVLAREEGRGISIDNLFSRGVARIGEGFRTESVLHEDAFLDSVLFKMGWLFYIVRGNFFKKNTYN